MSKFIHKSHNVSLLLYHLVCPAKYRRIVFTEDVDKHLRDVCLDISKRYEIDFIEIGTDEDHCHFLLQTIPTISPSKLVQIIKSITAREIFKECPSVKKELWGGEFWSKGYFINTVGQYGNENIIKNYVKNQGSTNYKKIHSQQIILF